MACAGARARGINAAFCGASLKKLPSVFSDAAQFTCLERKTQLQRVSKLWYDHRQVRVTARVFGEVVTHASSGKPSPSLLEKIVERRTSCQKQSAKAVRWGMEKEKEAVAMAINALGEVHTNLRCESVGLVIRGDHPHLGATPDGALLCDCEDCPQKRVKKGRDQEKRYGIVFTCLTSRAVQI